ncbi:MAG TPA: TadG family pilus assembly protein [Xanthobacteraceae bacterium]|nr:TadG family pilus assembly protein [Xanthobacteraceae bacterium]
MRNLLRSRRGSAAFATVIALVPLIGAVALGAEAGSWYVTWQHARNAADSAAYSGALRLACTIAGATCEAQSVDYRAKQFAAQSAFCNSGDAAYPGTNCASSLPTGISQAVQIDIGDYNAGAFTTPAAGIGNAVRARVSQQQPAYLAAVLGLTTVNIPAQAIAQVQQPSKLCGLSLGPDPNGGGGALKLGGNVSNNGTGCPLMSDASVQFASTPTFSGSGWAVLGATGCSPAGTCGNATVTHNYFMPPALDPLQGLKTETFNTMPTMTGNTNIGTVNCSTLSPPPGAKKCYSVNPNTAGTTYGSLGLNQDDYAAFVTGAPGTYFFNGNINVNGGGTVKFAPGTHYFNGNNFSGGGTIHFAPGTYFFNNVNININGGTVDCPTCTPWSGTGLGVTLVLLGTSSLSISGSTNVSLSAPVTNTFNSDLNGVLIDDQATGAVTINGNGSVALAGAMYFPKTDVSFGGTAQPANTTCSEVIAKTLTMTGGAYLSTDGCVPSTIAYSQVVALVQ